MKQKVVHYFIAVFLFITIWRCATISTPQGGPKDVTPPELTESNPKQNQKNFKRDEVELTFNEPIKLKDPKEEIIITPSIGKETNFIVKGNTLTIKPKDKWHDSTTYSLSFRDGVQDLSEGNPVPELRLAFSTGPIMDSLTIKGSIKDATSEKIPEKITIGLYTQDTFNIFKHTPSYFTQSNKDGSFKLQNLKPDNYLIYAFEDKNKNLKADSPAEIFGFLSDTIYLVKNIQGLLIPLLRIDTRPLKLTSGRSIQDLATIKFNKSVISYQISEENNLMLENSFGDDHTQVSVFINANVKDSVKIRVQAMDSLLQKVDTSLFIKRSPTKRQKDALKISFTPVQLDSAKGELRTTFTSNKIIKYFNYDSINLRLDSASVIHFTKADITFDSIFKKGIILKKIKSDQIIINRKNPPKLLLGKDFACSIENDSIKAQKLSIKTKTIEDTGTLSIDVNNTTTYDVILQLVAQDGKVMSSVTNPKKYVFENLVPNTYKLKIIHDKNCNAQWDFGNILLREEPEDVTYYKTLDDKYEFPIRANWEVGPFKITISSIEGKPKDEKPPRLISSNPKQLEKNFSGSTVTLTFDENIRLNNPKEQIFITPKIKDLEITASTKTLSITPKTRWEPSTTYTINFRDAVQDLKGGNIAPELKLVFSTGQVLDTISLKGLVKDALSESLIGDIQLALYHADSFKINKTAPLYLTNSSKSGRFIFNNIKEGKYKLVAIQDKNKNLKIDSPNESYGFLTTPISLTKNIDSLSVPIQKVDIRKPKIATQKTLQDLTTIQLNKSIISYSISEKANLKLENWIAATNSQLFILLNSKIKDSTKIRLQATDSLLQKLDTSFFIKRIPGKIKPDPISITFTKSEIDSASGNLTAEFTYSKKIKAINSHALILRLYNNQLIPFENKDIIIDSTKNRGSITKQLNTAQIFKNKKYTTRFELSKNFLTSIQQDSLKAQKIAVKLITQNPLGSIQVNVKNTQSRNFIVELLTQENRIIESQKNQNSITFRNLIPGSYKLRLIIDTNNNGKWDYGNILNLQDSEPTMFIKGSDKKSEIKIKDKIPVGPLTITI